MEEELVDIRCQLTVKYVDKHTNTDRERICNKKCLRAAPGSRGEAWCADCRKSFEFAVADQNKLFEYVHTKVTEEKVQ